jgi:AcrR family transcriptional regulator
MRADRLKEPRRRSARGQLDRAPPRGKYDRTHTPEERIRAQRARLFAAATRVLAAKGIAAATVDDVCTEAGVSRRTFYEQFGDLRHLLLELHDRLGVRAFRAVEQYVSMQSTARDRTRAGVEGFLGIIASFPDEVKVVFRELRAAGPAFTAKHHELIGRFTELLAKGVAADHAKGAFRVPPDEVRTYALIAAIEAVGLRYVERDDAEHAVEAADALVDMVMRTFA